MRNQECYTSQEATSKEDENGDHQQTTAMVDRRAVSIRKPGNARVTGISSSQKNISAKRRYRFRGVFFWQAKSKRSEARRLSSPVQPKSPIECVTAKSKGEL
jgi:hypothetical protein